MSTVIETSRKKSSIIIHNNGQRQGHLTAIMPLSRIDQEGQEVVDSTYLYNQVSTFLALKQIQQRSGDILPTLPQLLGNCNINLSMEYRDSHLSPIHAARELLNTGIMFSNDRQVNDNQNSTSYVTSSKPRPPFAVIGEYRSAVTEVLTVLGNPFELPVVAYASTSTDLDENPYFSRVVPTNAGDAMAIATYLQHLAVPFVGIFYVRDPWGTAFHTDLVRELQNRNITAISTSYVNNNFDDVEASLQHLSKSQCRYFVGIIGTDNYKTIHSMAHEMGIWGHPGYTWILTEADVYLNLQRDKDEEIDLARALHGTAVIGVSFPVNEGLDQALINFANNKTMQEEFIALQKEPEVFDDYMFPPPTQELFQYLAFDAAVALGIASCNTPGQFTGTELHNQILQTTFDGVTGPVAFDRKTGTRALDDIQFSVRNVLLSEGHPTLITSETVAMVTVGENGGEVSELRPFFYSDNSTFPPPPLPPVEENPNLISGVAQIVGLTIGGVAICFSFACVIWTLTHRRASVVCKSQPFFLCQICCGTMIIAFSVIPLSFQEPIPKHLLDAACMSVPWLLSIGFVTAFSAIFCKAWRLNKLLEHARSFRRIKLRPRDVMKPFMVLMGVNLALLLTWTVVDPLEWKRIDVTNYDSFGRVRESYGDCRSGKGDYYYLAFAIPVLLVNAAAVLIALYQCYKVKDFFGEYSESEYLGLSMVSLLDTVILAIPFLFALASYPSANFIVSSVFVALVCFTILLPVFVPIYFAWQRYRIMDSQYRLGGSNHNSGAIDSTHATMHKSIKEMPRPVSAAISNSENVAGVMKIKRRQDPIIPN